MATHHSTTIGSVFSRLTVTGAPFKDESGARARWRVMCRCECGVEKEILCDSLFGGSAQSCGCLRRELSAERRTKVPSITIGDKFGRLLVTGAPIKLTDKGRWRVQCLCECGNDCDVECKKLLSGHTKSCGCLWRKHGHASGTEAASSTYGSWSGAKSRCHNPDDPAYQTYGGRGIAMCDRWLNSFEDFLADMGERPEGKTLDRYPDVDGNYEPGNCRWATPIEQSNNKRNNVRHMFAGELRTIPQIAREIGISVHSLKSRMRAGWSLERATSEPIRKSAREA